MEFSGLRIFIYAVAAIALIWIFLAYIAPLFVSPAETVRQMNNALKISEMNLGKSYTVEVLYPGEFAARAADSVDAPDRFVSFVCNSAELCLSGAVVADERSMRVKDARVISTTFRCNYAEGLFYCRVYLGQEPAQLEFTGFDIGEKYDLSKNQKTEISFTVKNTGKASAVESTHTAKLYKKTIISGGEKEILYSEPFRKTVAEIKPGENETIGFDLGISENGKYSIVIRSEGTDAGFDEKKFDFEVSGGEGGTCRATAKGETELKGGGCRTEYLCTGCSAASECKWAWGEKEPSLEFEIADPEFAVVAEPETACEKEPDGGEPPEEIEKLLEFYAERYGVPPELAKAVAEQESGFRQDARSEVGAIGVMQIMPPSANPRAAGQDCINAGIISGEQELYEAEHNIECGVWYLRQRYNAYMAGDVCCRDIKEMCYTGWKAALRAYNGLYCKVGAGSLDYVESVLSHCSSLQACGVG